MDLLESHSWLCVLRYIDDYHPAFGQAFYDGTWMKGVGQEGIMRDIRMTSTPSIWIRSPRLVKGCWKDRSGNIDARDDIRGFEVTVDDSGRTGFRQCDSS